jgi:hypothetical protein
MYGLDPSKYPARLGKPWKEDEILKLLNSIKQKKPIEAIAAEHERTVGGINSYRKKLAVDYHFNDQRPMEQIERFTGLTREEIEEAIQRHASKPSKKPKNQEVEEEHHGPTMTEVMAALKDIQGKLNYLLDKVA